MYNVLIFIQVLSVVVTVVCVAILAFEKNRIQQKLLMLTSICAFAYCLGYSLEIMSKNYNEAIAGLKIEYIGASFLVICYIAFVINYFKKKHNLFVYGYVLIIDVLTVISVLKLEVCDWYYTSVMFSYEGVFPHLVIEKGPLYYLFFSNNVILVVYALTLVIEALFQQKKYKKSEHVPSKMRTLHLLMLTTVAPFVPYLLGSLGITKYFDGVPIGFLIAVLILLFIVIKDNIFDVVTGAHEQMFTTMNDAAIIINSQMEFLSANRAAVNIFPSLYQYQVEKTCPEEVIEVFENMEDEKPIEINGRYYERHGSKVYKDQALIGYSVLLIDITHSNELMNELRQMKDRADQANKSKSTFLANVSHELRTPLNAVLGYSDLIIQETDSKEETEHAYAIRKAADNLLSIINTILDISKIEAGKIDIERVEYETMELFSEVVNIVSIPAKAKGLKLDINIEPTLPASLFGDNVHIRQVLINILNNAVKFTEKGYVRLEIHGNKVGTGMIEMVYRITDTGRGIKKEDLEHIFERFEQAESEKYGNVEGTGLGLYISRSLVGLMGGKLEVESEYGKGSVFTIHLIQRICREETIAGIPLRITNKDKVKSEVSLYAPKARILSVDDNQVNNGVFYEFCKRFGIEARLADSGYKAIEILNKEQFDILFLDQMMPGIDGIETLKEIKKIKTLNPDMNILAFTANAIRGNTEFLLSVGFDDVVLKPIGINELEDVLLYYLPDDIKEKKERNENNKNKNDRASNILEEKISEGEVAAAYEDMKEEMLDQWIDKEIGLQHCNYDEELYEQTLQMILDFVPEKLDLIQKYAKEKEYESYIVEIHALKNNAALIGAMELSECAKRLEFAGKEGRFDEIERDTDSLMEKFRSLLKLMRKNIDTE